MSKDYTAKAKAVIAVVGGNCGIVAKEYLKIKAENERLKSAIKELSDKRYFLRNRADMVDGHYCIARKHPDGYSEFWHQESKTWCSAGTVFELGKALRGEESK